jgi:ATP-dependent DNA ligase
MAPRNSLAFRICVFVYAGKVDHGFDTTSAKDLQARLKPLIRKTQP